MWQSTYRDSRVGGASPIGLVIALFDRLAADLTQVAAAIQEGDIERRCRETNHALLVLAQLESWLDRDKGGEAAQQIALFYSQIRARLMQASIEQRAEPLREQIVSILDVRGSWQLLDTSPAAPEGKNTSASRLFEIGDSGQGGGRGFSRSA
jgi:flagellar protein FliS